ncbi:MAG: hypothetical protein SGJ10_11455 [Bacteroidota bacterium]|nr:hypothetical protein [Bacteroidota bacterium]
MYSERYLISIGHENIIFTTGSLFVCGSPPRRGGGATAVKILYQVCNALYNKYKQVSGNLAVDSTTVCPSAKHSILFGELEKSKITFANKNTFASFLCKKESLRGERGDEKRKKLNLSYVYI